MSRPPETTTRALGLRLAGFAAAMFAFGYLLVPAYDVFCELTGFGGRPNDKAATDVVVEANKTRQVTLEFVTTVNQYAPWDFAANQLSIEIHPGGLYEVGFVATNLTDSQKIARAVPSIAPSQAAEYFKKLECFCFSSQVFAPGEKKDMPVRFVIDDELPEYIDTITLSYTFFDQTGLVDAPADMTDGR